MLFTRATAFVFLGSLFFASVAEAKPGYTGYAGVGNQTCGGCHSGGAVPTVSFKVAPTTLARGQSGSFTFGVAGTLARTEIDIAAVDANGLTLKLTGDNTTTTTVGNEVIPVGNYFTGASKDYSFTFTPPANAASPVTLYAVGMASNGSGTGGDGVAKTTFQVTLSSASGGVDAGGGTKDSGAGNDSGTSSDSGGSSTSSSSGGASSSSSSGTSGTSGTSGASGTATGDDAGTGEGEGATPGDDFNDAAGGCSMGDTSRPTAASAIGLLLALVAWSRRSALRR